MFSLLAFAHTSAILFTSSGLIVSSQVPPISKNPTILFVEWSKKHSLAEGKNFISLGIRGASSANPYIAPVPEKFVAALSLS